MSETELDAERFDCFLSYNSEDRPAVRQLAADLGNRGIAVWLDIEQLRPGLRSQHLLQAGIRASRTVAVLVGASGLDPWQEEIMQVALSLAVKEGRRVIPVLLPTAPAEPDLPDFLAQRTWVDMRPTAESEVGPRLTS